MQEYSENLNTKENGASLIRHETRLQTSREWFVSCEWIFILMQNQGCSANKEMWERRSHNKKRRLHQIVRIK